MRLLPLAAALVGALVLAVPASAKTTHAKVVVVKGGQTICFATIPAEGNGIGCSSTYLPDTGELDPYVSLNPRGASQLGERGDYPGYNTPNRTVLRPGDRWTWRGITCTSAPKSITCRNRDRQGFTIGPDGYAAL